MALNQTFQGHQLGVVSVDVNMAGNGKHLNIVFLRDPCVVLASTSLDSQIRIWDLTGSNKDLTKVIDAGPGNIIKTNTKNNDISS